MKNTLGDIIILQLCTINDNHDVWFLRYGARQTELFVILDYFLPFYTTNNPANQNFKKMKKLPGDIIISETCTIKDNHVMYGSWDMECDRHNFLLFWTIFFSFTPLKTPQKSKFSKTAGDIIILQKVCQKSWSYAVLFSRYGTWLIFFILDYLLTFHPLTDQKNENFKKMKTTPGDITILHVCTKNYDQMMYSS